MKSVITSYFVEELFTVKEKVVLVTGSGGIGTVLSVAFAKNGAKVYLADLNEDNLKEAKEEALLSKAILQTLSVDVTERTSVEACFREVLEREKKLDVLIHTAGIGKSEKAFDFSESDIRRILDVNLVGTIFTNQQAAKIMKDQREGKIINLGSIGGVMAHTLLSMPYAASKAGVHQVTRAFAAEMADYGVNVNCIAPAWVNTPLIAGKDASYYENITRSVPFGRVCEPEELLGTVFFLASDASNFVTGQTILVDGGWSATKVSFL